MLNIRQFTLRGESLTETFNYQPQPQLENLIAGEFSCQLTLEGALDEQHRPVLNGQAEAELKSICQVCLEAFDWHHQFEFRVYPVTEHELELLDEVLEPVLCLEEGANIGLDVNAMLLHELILSLPDVLSHQTATGTDCSHTVKMTAGEPIEKKASPFEVLKQLKS